MLPGLIPKLGTCCGCDGDGGAMSWNGQSSCQHASSHEVALAATWRRSRGFGGFRDCETYSQNHQQKSHWGKEEEQHTFVQDFFQFAARGRLHKANCNFLSASASEFVEAHPSAPNEMCDVE